MDNEVSQYKGGSDLIALALNRQADPAVLSRLMDLQERWEAQNARKSFVLAMSAFKQEAPAALKKGDRVDFATAKGRTAYNYANLGSIVQEITAILGKHELSATWQTCQDEKGNITVTCNVTHAAGHRESVALTGPPEDSGNKNCIQAIGSAVTYLQRYTLLAALGLATTDDDDDGRGGKQDRPPVEPPKSKPKEAAPEQKTAVCKVYDATEKNGVTKKTDKDGKEYNAEWTLYSITDLTGTVYKTFERKYKEMADAAIEHGYSLKLSFVPEKNGNRITACAVEE